MSKGIDKVLKSLDLTFEEVTLDNQKLEDSHVFEVRGTANSGLKDRWNEVMPKSCWDLANYQKNPILLHEHNHGKPIGKVTEMYVTDTGLKFVAQIGKIGCNLTELQKEVINLVRQDILKTFSVGFSVKDYDYDKTTDTLVYKDVELLEISLVSIPMDANAVMNEYGYKSFLKTGGNEMKELLEKFATIESELKSFKEVEKKALAEKIASLETSLKEKSEALTSVTIELETIKQELTQVNEMAQELAKLVSSN